MPLLGKSRFYPISNFLQALARIQLFERRQKNQHDRRRELRDEQYSVFGATPELMSGTQLPLYRDVGLHVAELELNGMGRTEAIVETAKKI